jgi:hypothetical protein
MLTRSLQNLCTHFDRVTQSVTRMGNAMRSARPPGAAGNRSAAPITLEQLRRGQHPEYMDFMARELRQRR